MPDISPSSMGDAGGFTAPVTEATVAGLALADKIDNMYAREAAVLAACRAFLFVHVFTVQQSLKMHVHSWCVRIGRGGGLLACGLACMLLA